MDNISISPFEKGVGIKESRVEREGILGTERIMYWPKIYMKFKRKSAYYSVPLCHSYIVCIYTFIYTHTHVYTYIYVCVERHISVYNY